MKKPLLGIIVLLALACAAWRHVNVVFNKGTTSSGGWTILQEWQTGCTATASTCSATMASTTAGSVWLVRSESGNNTTISSVTGGSATWHLYAASGCQVSNVPAGLGSEDCAYALNGAAGTTTYTVNLNTAASSYFNVNLIEALPPMCGGVRCSTSSDVVGVTSNASCTTCSMASLSLTATDFVMEIPIGIGSTSPTRCSSPYWTDASMGGCYALNLSGTTSPTVLNSPAGPIIAIGAAFKSAAGTFSATPPPLYTLVDGPNNVGVTCSPACPTFGIASTTAGELGILAMTSSNTTSDVISSVSGCGTWVVPTGANTCQLFNTNAGSISCAYNLSMTGSCTSITVTMSQSAGNVWGPDYSAWSRSSGSWTLDTQGSTFNSSATALPPGQALTLTGTNDLIFQGIEACQSNSSFQVVNQTLDLLPAYNGGGCNNAAQFGAFCAVANSINGAAPTWGGDVGTCVSVVDAIAFK